MRCECGWIARTLMTDKIIAGPTTSSSGLPMSGMENAKSASKPGAGMGKTITIQEQKRTMLWPYFRDFQGFQMICPHGPRPNAIEKANVEGLSLRRVGSN